MGEGANSFLGPPWSPPHECGGLLGFGTTKAKGGGELCDSHIFA